MFTINHTTIRYRIKRRQQFVPKKTSLPKNHELVCFQKEKKIKCMQNDFAAVIAHSFHSAHLTGWAESISGIGVCV